MKTIKLLLVTAIVFVISQPVNAQSDNALRTAGIITTSIKVYSECTMSMKKIETAAYGVADIRSVVWNADSKRLIINNGVFKKDAKYNVQRKLRLPDIIMTSIALTM